jgi:hypothetical protein
MQGATASARKAMTVSTSADTAGTNGSRMIVVT